MSRTATSTFYKMSSKNCGTQFHVSWDNMKWRTKGSQIVDVRPGPNSRFWSARRSQMRVLWRAFKRWIPTWCRVPPFFDKVSSLLLRLQVWPLLAVRVIERFEVSYSHLRLRAPSLCGHPVSESSGRKPRSWVSIDITACGVTKQSALSQ